jgi:hypothetical protein
MPHADDGKGKSATGARREAKQAPRRDRQGGGEMLAK